MHYALPSKQKYPIETEEQVKTAAAYFTKYLGNFHPAERVAIASTMEKRASELGVDVDAPWMSNYSRKGDIYSPEFDTHMRMRKQACDRMTVKIAGKDLNAGEVLQKIAGQKNVMKPNEMVDMLGEFDKTAGITGLYDKMIRDPFFTVYGSSVRPEFDKKAGLDGVDEKSLTRSIGKKAVLTKLAECFGNDFVEGFKKDPVAIYNSMPAPERELIREQIGA